MMMTDGHPQHPNGGLDMHGGLGVHGSGNLDDAIGDAGSAEGRKLVILGLPWDTAEETLQNYFCQVCKSGGRITSARRANPVAELQQGSRKPFTELRSTSAPAAGVPHLWDCLSVCLPLMLGSPSSVLTVCLSGCL
jgi:hypothetical protein